MRVLVLSGVFVFECWFFRGGIDRYEIRRGSNAVEIRAALSCGGIAEGRARGDSCGAIADKDRREQERRIVFHRAIRQ